MFRLSRIRFLHLFTAALILSFLGTGPAGLRPALIRADEPATFLGVDDEPHAKMKKKKKKKKKKGKKTGKRTGKKKRKTEQ